MQACSQGGEAPRRGGDGTGSVLAARSSGLTNSNSGVVMQVGSLDSAWRLGLVDGDQEAAGFSSQNVLIFHRRQNSDQVFVHGVSSPHCWGRQRFPVAQPMTAS